MLRAVSYAERLAFVEVVQFDRIELRVTSLCETLVLVAARHTDHRGLGWLQPAAAHTATRNQVVAGLCAPPAVLGARLAVGLQAQVLHTGTLPPGEGRLHLRGVCGQVAVLPGEGLWLWVVRSRWRTTFQAFDLHVHRP